MKTCAIVGVNWGDEGKGRMVDLLSGQYDIVIRYQGGGNAGHTVVNQYGKFALHLLPSGIFRPDAVNVLGNGVALDPENLWTEIEDLRSRGVPVSPENLKISDRASLLLPWHRLLDGLEEARLKDRAYGSTRQGIAPFYSDKAQKKTVLAGELFYPDRLAEHLRELLEWKNLTLTRVYGAAPCSLEELMAWVSDYGEKIKPFLCIRRLSFRMRPRPGKACSLRPNWVPCATWITASIPLRPPPIPLRPTRRWAPACRRQGSIRSSASSRPIPPVWARGPSSASCSATRLRAFARRVRNTVPRPDGPGASAPSISLRPGTESACRAQQSLR